jgi:excisionase family DNA binding protein
MDDSFFDTKEVSRYLKIPMGTIYKLSQKGEIPSVKIGKQLRFRKSSIDKWITQKEAGSKGRKDALISFPREVEPINSKGKHILLIDDDELVLRSIARFFESQGYNVEVAKSADEALEKMENSSYDLLITDIRMPGTNGLEAIKKIRELNNRYNRSLVPEVIITGYIDTKTEQEAEKLGITDYLYKPFAITDIMNVVQQKLGSNAGLN